MWESAPTLTAATFSPSLLLQVSLWGGDATFTNLDLRLDVLKRELGLPFSFVSGHIHELQIHVPWTRLNTEPIVITINTIGKLHA